MHNDQAGESGAAAPVAPRRPVVVRSDAAARPPVVPYATPMGAGVRTERRVAWRGKELIIPDGDSIADRCIRCNDTSDGQPIKRRLSWHPSALFLLIIFPGLLIYLIVALIVRKRATIYVGLCQRHRRARRTMIAVAWGLFALSIGAFVLVANVRDSDVGGTVAVGGGVGIFASIVMAVIISQQLGYPSCIRPPFVWLKGVNRQYPAPR
jgi:hypothetical protein